MSEAARRAAAERKPDDGAPHRAKADLVGTIRFVSSASDQNVQHQKPLPEAFPLASENASHQTTRNR